MDVIKQSPSVQVTGIGAFNFALKFDKIKKVLSKIPGTDDYGIDYHSPDSFVGGEESNCQGPTIKVIYYEDNELIEQVSQALSKALPKFRVEKLIFSYADVV